MSASLKAAAEGAKVAQAIQDGVAEGIRRYDLHSAEVKIGGSVYTWDAGFAPPPEAPNCRCKSLANITILHTTRIDWQWATRGRVYRKGGYCDPANRRTRRLGLREALEKQAWANYGIQAQPGETNASIRARCLKAIGEAYSYSIPGEVRRPT